jgi:hypothetical protein
MVAALAAATILAIELVVSKLPFPKRRWHADTLTISRFMQVAIVKTLHLLSSPTNAARLRSVIDELNASGGTEGQLIESQSLAPCLLNTQLERLSALAS